MIKLQNRKITLKKTLHLTPRQEAHLKSLSEDKKQKYMLSLLGYSKTSINLPLKDRSRIGFDSLKEKRTGTVLTKLRSILDNSGNASHAPLHKNKNSRWIGVEIECLIDSPHGTEDCYDCDGTGTYDDDTCNACDGSGQRGNLESTIDHVRNELTEAKITCCSVRGDSSIGNSEKCGIEVCLLFDSTKGFEKLHKLCEVLSSLEATVNATCGLHVHFDQSQLSQDEVRWNGAKLGHFLPILSKFVPESRRSNEYCRLRVSDFDGDRYSAINMTSYHKHKTIEVRLHSGTVIGEKIQNWIELLQSILALGRLPEAKKTETFQELLDALNLKPELVEYLDRRFQKFNPNEAPTAPQSGNREFLQSAIPF